MKLRLCGAKYEIMPVPPSLAPYQARINELMNRKPENIQEIKDASNELHILIRDVLKETVTPEPPKEHELAVFKALMKVTNQTLKQVQFFPGRKGSNVKKGGAAGASTPQTSKRDSKS